MRLTAPLLAALALPVPATAHPHIFVEAQVTVIFADDGAISVKLDWFYDDLFSLLVTSDLGIDMDGDLLLTVDEQALLDDQITAWPPDYTGDLEVSQDGVALTLADKQNHTMTYEGGLFHEAHVRPVHAMADPATPLEIRVYDPSFYTAYELRAPVIVAGRNDCAVQIIPADIEAAYALAESQLDGRDPSTVGPDEYFPAIGDAFADSIIVTCADLL
jgi:ABC-type uncharacterized transport system substrate-binding protein